MKEVRKMKDISFDKPRICCDNCGKCHEGSCMEERVDEYEESIKDYGKLCDGMRCNNYFSKTDKFLCGACAQVRENTLVIDEENSLLEYFKLIEVFDNLKTSFVKKKLETIQRGVQRKIIY